MTDFVGAKGAFLLGDQLLVFLRDNKPGLPFANMWDFPGGGREDNETPIETLTREVKEEFEITLKPSSIIWEKEHPSMADPHKIGYFFVVEITQEDVDRITFGQEGQRWELMPINEFLKREDVVPHLKGRLSGYLNAKKN